MNPREDTGTSVDRVSRTRTRDDFRGGSLNRKRDSLPKVGFRTFERAENMNTKHRDTLTDKSRMNRALKLAREKMKNYEDRNGSIEVNLNGESGAGNGQSVVKPSSQTNVENQWKKEDQEIADFQKNIQKMKSRLEYHAMDRASKLLDIKNSNN